MSQARCGVAPTPAAVFPSPATAPPPTGAHPTPGSKMHRRARQVSPSITSVTHAVPILWLCGASGVGKSTVGYEVFRLLYASGRKCAYVDLDQIGFARSAPSADPDNHRLKSRNLALLWASFRVEQVQGPVTSGIVDSDEAIKMHRDAVPQAEIAVYRLTVRHEQLRSRSSRGAPAPDRLSPAMP